MHKIIAELEQLTNHLVEHIDDASDVELIRFVDRRGTLIKRILELAGESKIEGSNRNQLENIFKYDSLIKSKMNAIKQSAANELNKVSMGRTQKSGYDVMYQTDGVFFDKRK